MNSANIAIPFQDLRTTNFPLLEDLEEAAMRVIRSGRFINGREVAAFERALADRCGASYCVAVSTGLDALRLILLGYKEMGLLRDGDEVVVPANTFIATFLAVTHSGLTAVAADIDEATFCLDFNRLPLTEKTRAVIPVHLFGNPCWHADQATTLRERGILLIEDNAQALGARSDKEGFNGNSLTGNLGDAGAVSFYPAKNIGALGDAGAVLTNSQQLADTVRTLANYGAPEKYLHKLPGLNCRMDEIQAAMLCVKLKHLDEITEKRRTAALLYDRLITNPEITKPCVFTGGARQSWHQYVVRHPQRDSLRRFLADNGIATEIHYPVPCHLQPCYRANVAVRTQTPLPVVERLAREILSLPIADVTEEEINYIADKLNIFHT